VAVFDVMFVLWLIVINKRLLLDSYPSNY